MQSFGLQSPGAAAVLASSGDRSGADAACGLQLFMQFSVEI
jgi:hypothetical protein